MRHLQHVVNDIFLDIWKPSRSAWLSRPSSLQFSMTRARLATQPSSAIAIATCETEDIGIVKAMLRYTANNQVLVFTTLSESCIQLLTFKVTACYVV